MRYIRKRMAVRKKPAPDGPYGVWYTNIQKYATMLIEIDMNTKDRIIKRKGYTNIASIGELIDSVSNPPSSALAINSQAKMGIPIRIQIMGTQP